MATDARTRPRRSPPLDEPFASAAGVMPLLGRDEEYDAATRLRAGDPAARELLAASNLRLVFRVALDLAAQTRTRVDVHDLIQEGTLGLCRALDDFDPDLVRIHDGRRYRVRFATYAHNWIANAVRAAIRRDSNLIAIPKYLSDHLVQLRRDPSHVADRFPVRGERVAEGRAATGRVRSLGGPPTRRDPTPLAPPVVDDADRPESIVAGLLACLTPEERAVVVRHYGLDGNGEATIAAIASGRGTTRRAAQMSLDAATRRIREHAARSGTARENLER